MGLLLEVFLEVAASLQLLSEIRRDVVTGTEELHLERNSLCSSLSPDVSSEKSQEHISLRGIFTVGEVGQTGLPLSTSCRNRRKCPHPLPAQGAEMPQ